MTHGGTVWHTLGMTKTRTEAEAITDILAALHRRVRTAEWDYGQARKLYPAGSVYRRETRAALEEALEASIAAQRIAETVNAR